MSNTIQPSGAYANGGTLPGPKTPQPTGYKPPPSAPGFWKEDRNAYTADGVADSGVNWSVPFPPTNVVAAAGDNVVTLSWDAVRGAGETGRATSYNIYRNTFSESGTLIANVATAGYVDDNVVDGTTYYYEVTAVNPAGESEDSVEVTATPAVPIFLSTALLRHWALTRATSGTRVSQPGGDDLLEFTGAVPAASAAGSPANLGASFAASFDGSGRDLETNANLVGGATGSLSVAVWLKPADIAHAQPVLQNSFSFNKGFLLALGWDGSGGSVPGAAVFVVYPAGKVSVSPPSGRVVVPSGLLQGAWNLLVGTYDAATKDLTLTVVNANGTFTATTPGASSPSGYVYENGTWLSLADSGLGKSVSDSLNGYSGLALNLDIWQRVVSPTGVQNLYGGGNGVAFANYGTTIG